MIAWIIGNEDGHDGRQEANSEQSIDEDALDFDVSAWGLVRLFGVGKPPVVKDEVPAGRVAANTY